MDVIGQLTACLPLVELNRWGHARLLAERPLFRLDDGGLGARIRRRVRPVLLDAVHRHPFVWQRRPFPGPALPPGHVPELTRRELEHDVAALLRAHGEGWSPQAVRDAVRPHVAAAALRDVLCEEGLDGL
ncbi:hypothetical protein ACI6QG_05655 [Roseococcus sp. DSY-14]|uniref:hypothetical protein n=1 Tax=Roseococcus sp. DSY-14 TaxID=3369650 RepID=UPI00387B8561